MNFKKIIQLADLKKIASDSGFGAILKFLLLDLRRIRLRDFHRKIAP